MVTTAHFTSASHFNQSCIFVLTKSTLRWLSLTQIFNPSSPVLKPTS